MGVFGDRNRKLHSGERREKKPRVATMFSLLFFSLLLNGQGKMLGTLAKRKEIQNCVRPATETATTN